MIHSNVWKGVRTMGTMVVGAGLLSVVATGCRVHGEPGRVSVSGPGVVVRKAPPPPKKEARRECPRGAYWKAGRWKWTGDGWKWFDGGCKRLPPRRRGRGCRWVRGRWVKTRRGYRWKSGRWQCRGGAGVVAPRRAKTVAAVGVPTRMPPKPRIRAKECPAGSYYKPGRYHWRKNRWVWMAGGCKARPKAYRRAGCRWVRGGWKRVGRKVVWKTGGWKCRARKVRRRRRRRCPAGRVWRRGKCRRRR
jgi:hypothetical protein